MKKIYLLATLLFTLGFLYAQDTTLCLQRSAVVLSGLQDDELDAQKEFYSTELMDALAGDGLKGAWAQLEAASGKFIESGEFILSKYQEYLLVTSNLIFEKRSYQLKLSFNEENNLVGIFFAPLRKAEVYELTDNAVLSEVEVSIASKVDLPGILTMPKGKQNVPIAVLVHGSGPQDRDATIGPNKIFKDIAHYLAEKGIASIRYDKRSFLQTGLDPDKLTVWDVTIDDALAVVKFAQKIEQVNAKNVFIIGHSLGAHLAPRILAQDPSIKGAVMLAGNVRPLQDIILEQMTYLKSQDGLTDEETLEINYIKGLCKNADKAQSRFRSYEKNQLPLGVPQSFYADLNMYKPLKTAKQISQPLFIAQGERDYQVTMVDFNLWKKKLKKKTNVQCKSYPKLNHLFMEGEGVSTPKEYEIQSNVSKELLSDIAEWILLQS